jgi:tetratricopeptide (TPR) repeat protein
LCDDLINVCEELEMFDEANKYRDIKVSAEKDMHNNLDAAELSILNTLDASLKDIEKAKEYFYRGNLKEGLKQFYKYSEYLKETYGEESPEYKEFMSEMMPFIIMSNSDNGNISLTALDESVDFIKSKFGENSVRYAEFLILISEAISDSKEFDFSEKCAKKAKEICINLNLKNTFTYQESNLVLINSLIMQNRTNELQDVVSEIDFSVFKSKNDYEKLVKYAGMALVELNEYEKAIEISKALVEKKSVTPMIYCMACYILSQAFIEQGNADEALTYLKKEKPILDSLDNTILKEDYVSLYYCNYSCIYALKGDNNKAIDILNKYLIKIDTDDNFIKSNVVSRMYIYRTNYYRNMHDFNGGLESIKPVLKLIEIGDVFYKWHIEILYNASVCFTATGDIDKGIELFTQLENIFYFDEKDATLKMLDYLIFFIDALLVGGSYKVYNYIEKAENIVNENNLQKTFLNAQLLNYKGVYLSDYQNENGLANNSFNEAKELLEELNESNSPLYEQVLKNIEYVRDITVKSIIKDMAKSMLDN